MDQQITNLRQHSQHKVVLDLQTAVLEQQTAVLEQQTMVLNQQTTVLVLHGAVLEHLGGYQSIQRSLIYSQYIFHSTEIGLFLI